MTLIYASTFADLLNRLIHNEQNQVELTTVDLMLDPRGNGLQMHRVERSDGSRTVRVSQDLRIVAHRDGEDTLLAYVDHRRRRCGCGRRCNGGAAGTGASPRVLTRMADQIETAARGPRVA